MSPAAPSAVHGGLVLGLILGLLALVAPAPADATSTYLCSGYQGCANKGYSHAGYASANDRMYWRMYAGHNCTNYAAYRMVKAGMPNERPWSGSGMAYNWGIANADITDQTPKVGAIAWWNRNTGGVGSSGHVAYVEKVISSREIVISEDSWGGDFDWRRIVKDGSGWPSGFIHFKDQAPPKILTSTAPPTIVGTPRVGVQLKATVGGWKGGPTAYDFQWLTNGVVIPGATATAYTPTSEDLNRTISLRVTAKRRGFQSGTATSAPSAPVAKGAFAIVSPTAVAGAPLVDEVLTATPGTFSPSPERAAIQWRVDGEIIPGATGRSLRLDRALVGRTVTALTIARAEGFVKSTSHSPPAGPVLAGAIEVTEPYAVTGRARIGETLTIRPGTVTPPDSAFYYTWLRDGEPFGAYAATHQLTAADVGHRLSAQVRLAKAHYLERIEVVPVGLVRTPSTVNVKAAGKRGKAVVNILVSAQGAGRPPGEVVVRIGNVKVTAPLKEGRARVVVRDLEPGRRLVKVLFTGTTVVEKGRGTDVVQIKK
ncbi:MAG: CHAP domain-containing protein [Actinomycetota bacterium]|nr:CHAP domain-containing protein [Actinomycetota bacterium]